jgi:enoyl-CoA hydratase/carnithine racemase
MTEQLVTYELQGDVALIGLDRADKRNAINKVVIAQ